MLPLSRAPTTLLRFRFRLPQSLTSSPRNPHQNLNYSTTSPPSDPSQQHTILNRGPANISPNTSADKPLPPTVSETNATPVSAGGTRDAPMVESVEDAEGMRTMQAPNRKGVWSRSQAQRSGAMVGPRFEQTMMEYQAHTHHKKHLESLPSTPYPLRPTNDPVEVEEVQRVSDEAYGQR
ncbi:MAG: hypothetical protein MMC33_007558 [Icmadophila ericetorum]|nr:hypothetical protein [Icmadophila ericetorum]